MPAALRAVGGIVCGLALAFALVVAVEFFGAVVHPLPADFDGSMEQMCQHVERYPAWVLAVVVPAWAATAFAGTWLAGRLGNRGCALFVGLLLVAGVVLNISMLPYPLWFKLASVIASFCAAACGVYYSRRRDTATLSVAT